MATPVLVTVRDFTSSRYAQLAENAEGVNLGDVLARAETVIQTKLGRSFLDTEYTETFRAESQALFVRNRPIISVTSIRRRPNLFYGWETLSLSRVRIESKPGYIECADTVAGYEVEITYRAGYTTVPEDIKEAIILQAVLLSYQDLEIYGAGDAKKPGIVYINEDIDRMIQPHRASATVYH